MEAYFAAKAGLFTPQRSRRGVVCVDDEWGRRLARARPPFPSSPSPRSPRSTRTGGSSPAAGGDLLFDLVGAGRPDVPALGAAG